MAQIKSKAYYEKPAFEVKEVSWATVDGKQLPTMFQAQVTVVRPNGDKKTLVGDPMPSREAAKESLAKELYQRMQDVQRCVNNIEMMDSI